MDIEDFEITPEGEVIWNGSIWSKEDFVKQFDWWLQGAAPGGYLLERQD